MLIQLCQTGVINMVSCGSVLRSTLMVSVVTVRACVCLLRNLSKRPEKQR